MKKCSLIAALKRKAEYFVLLYKNEANSLSEAGAGLVSHTNLRVTFALHLIFFKLLLAEGYVSLRGMFVELLATPLTLGPIVILLSHSCCC
jgi:hypothetical protein